MSSPALYPDLRERYPHTENFVFRVWDADDPSNLHESPQRYGGRYEAAIAGQNYVRRLQWKHLVGKLVEKGATEARILAGLGRRSVDEVNDIDLHKVGGLLEAIQRGDTDFSNVPASRRIPGNRWRMHAFSPQWPERHHDPHKHGWPPVPAPQGVN